MFSLVQSLSPVQLFVTPWTAVRQASLSFSISQSLLKRKVHCRAHLKVLHTFELRVLAIRALLISKLLYLLLSKLDPMIAALTLEGLKIQHDNG